jgi:multiple sugar transport system substrate-binding protein
MKGKFIVIAIVTMLLVPLLAACGGDTGSTSGSQPTAGATAAGAQPTDTAAASGAQPTDTVASGAQPTDTAGASGAAGAQATDTPAPVAAGADTSPTPEPTDTAIAGRTQLTLWTHSAGNADELTLLKQEIADFNKSQQQYQVIYQAFPQGSYNDSIAAASVANSLPCIIDMDGPTVPNFAWSKYIIPLPDTNNTLAGFNSAALGEFQDKTYSFGQFDVALTVFARKSVLQENNIRIPTMDQPWTLDEFNKALDTLKASGKFEYPLDLNSQGTGEWWPYAYSPMLQSFGGDLIDRKTYTTAEGALNGPEAKAWGDWFQNLFKNKYANPKPADDQAFLQGRTALWYNGSWGADDVVKKYGDDALFLPPPDLGKGPKIGGASWQWGISSSCKDPDGAWQFLQVVAKPENVAQYSKLTGLIPTRQDAADMTEKYGPNGAYQIFFQMAQKFAVLRPATPGYLIISSQFEKAGQAIRDAADVQDTLDDAVDAIDRDIQDHDYYGFKK